MRKLPQLGSRGQRSAAQSRRSWLALWLQERRRKRVRGALAPLLPAPVLRAEYPSLLAWDWDLANPFKWNIWMSLNSGATWILLEDYWAYGNARQFAPDGGSLLYFIVGVDALGREITEHSDAVVPDSAEPPSTLPNGLVAYWDGTSEYDVMGSEELLCRGETGAVGVSVLLPDATEGLGVVANSVNDYFYSKSAVFDDYSGRTTNCWVYLDYGDVMSLMSDWTEDSSGSTTGFALELAPGSWVRLTSCFWNAGAEYYDYEMVEEFETIPLGEWVMVTLTVEVDQAKLYVNGVLVTTLIKFESTVHNTTNPESFYWNGRDHYGNSGNTCKLVFLGAWSRVLTGTEITELYNNGDGRAYAGL